MKRIYCDKCGKSIEKDDVINKNNSYQFMIDGTQLALVVFDNEDKNKDFCKTCVVKAIMKSFDINIKVEPHHV